MKNTDAWRLRVIADAAHDAAQRTESRYIQGYANGVEDVLRYFAGDAAPTAELRDIIPSNVLKDES